MHDLLSPDLQFRVESPFVLFKRNAGTVLYVLSVGTCMPCANSVYIVCAYPVAVTYEPTFTLLIVGVARASWTYNKHRMAKQALK